MIQKLAQTIKAGTKFFVGHGETNDNTNRESVGEIVASFIKEISGKVSNVIIGHFPDKEKVIEMDVCSMEADVHTDEENIVGDINNVSGIALANSDSESPAFVGALRLNSIHCFEIQAEKPGEGAKKMPLTFQEVAQAVKDLNIFPHQLFGEKEMRADNVFKQLYDNESKLSSDNERLTKENKDILEKNKTALRSVDVKNAQSVLDESLKEGFTEKQITFINNKFEPKNMDDLTIEGINKFVEGAKKDFSSTAKLFGVTDQSSVLDNGDSGNKPDQESDKSMEDQALELIGVK